jgi:transposase
MAPNLATSQHDLIYDMVLDKKMKVRAMADVAECSKRSIIAIRSNMRYFGSTKAPPNGGGRPRSITPQILEVLCEHLLEKPGLYLEEMAVFLWDEFDVLVSPSSIRRALRSRNWSKKTARRVAMERNPDLRDLYLYNLFDFRSYYLVYVNESGYDKLIGFRKTSWSPFSVAPIQIAKSHRGHRYQILPAYSQDGILLHHVFQGSTEGEIFEDFIEQLLPHCSRWPEPKSVIVIDNTSLHRTDRVERLCAEVGVKLAYLPPYSPDLNPIEGFFAELKGFIKKHWEDYRNCPE